MLFLVTLQLLFDAPTGSRMGGLAGRALTYVPIVFMALVALLWGTRGATLAAFAGALIAMVNTAQGEGPFAGVEGFLGDPELEVEGYALAIALTGLLIAVLAAAQRNAARDARDWQTRFEAAIGAHRLLAYEWDPASGQHARDRRRGDAAGRARRADRNARRLARGRRCRRRGIASASASTSGCAGRVPRIRSRTRSRRRARSR